MKFNYQSEKRKFEKEWKQLRNEYVKAGMEETAIQAMYEYDWEMFKKERVFCIHNQYMPDGEFDNGDPKDEGQNPLLSKFIESLSVMDEYFQDEIYGWVNEINDSLILKCIKQLPEEQIELITLYVFQEKSLMEIAEILGISYVAVANRLGRIRKKLKKMKMTEK